MDVEQITPRLRKIGNFYELNGEPLRKIVGRPRVEMNPFDFLWMLRESARELLGGELPDDSFPDVPVRKIVGKTGPR